MCAMGDGRCKKCNARIIWATNPKTGKRAPYDATPGGVGHLLIRDDDGTTFTGNTPPRELTMGDKSYVWVNHFATCPNADQHRRKKP